MSPGVLSPWVVLPIAAALMLVVAALQAAIQRADAPPSRKRIRSANGVVMLLAIPLLAAGFCLVNPTLAPRAFLLVWAAAIGLLCIAVLLAVLDMMNTWRLTTTSRRSLHDSFQALSRARAHRLAREPEDERSGARDGE